MIFGVIRQWDTRQSEKLQVSAGIKSWFSRQMWIDCAVNIIKLEQSYPFSYYSSDSHDDQICLVHFEAFSRTKSQFTAQETH